ncbi:MAG: HU family DNA-binding protein [Limnochordaceae bacterium]|nr:HU family DNA-binding protein [Limnochordaceae bacterium]
MNKSDLVNRVAEKANVTKKQAADVVDAVFSTISEALSGGEKVTLVGFGTFEVRERKARMGVNPATHQPISIPASRVPSFKAGKELKQTVVRP